MEISQRSPILLTLVTTLLMGLNALAVSIQGVIEKSSQGTFIEIEDKTYPLQITQNQQNTSHLTKETLNKLESGDFISAQGEIKSSVVKVQQIDFVGLNKLLGQWAAENQDIFSFETHFDLKLHTQALNALGPRNSTVALKYSMAPSQGKKWSLFMVSNKKIILGELKFVKKKIRITLLNQQTGQIAQNITLTPVSEDALE